MMEILGVKYHNVTFAAAVESAQRLMEQDRKSAIFFLNLDCLSKAVKDREYRDILADTTLVLPDGVGLRLATKLFGGRMAENCNGTDFAPVLMKMAAQRGWKIFFLGGIDGIAQKAAENVRAFIPGIQIVGTHSGFFQDEERLIKQINDSQAQILFVALGAPMQEKWIARHRQRLNPKLCLGVGAFLDYMSGTILRAPRVMQMMHIEWLWRVLIDPSRLFRRYFINGIGFMLYLTFAALKSRLISRQ